MTLIVALLFALTTIMLVLLYTDSTIVPTGSIDLGRMNLLKGGE